MKRFKLVLGACVLSVALPGAVLAAPIDSLAKRVAKYAGEHLGSPKTNPCVCQNGSDAVHGMAGFIEYEIQTAIIGKKVATYCEIHNFDDWGTFMGTTPCAVFVPLAK